jgi:hypothetical protein
MLLLLPLLLLSMVTPTSGFADSDISLFSPGKSRRSLFLRTLDISGQFQQSATPTKRHALSRSIDDEEFANASDFPGGSSSIFPGAGMPRLDLQPQDIPSLLMKALQNNDIPDVDAGLKSVWEFASGTTRYIFDYNRTDFIRSAHETAEQWPTSFYGVAMHGQSWEIESGINRVGGDDGWIATQVMKTISSDGRMRRWQWELRKNRRPPGQGLWLVETIGSSDRKGNFEADPDC